MKAYFTSRQIAGQLKDRIGYGTSQKDIAEELGVSRAYLSDFLSGRREVGPTILKALGYGTAPFYRPSHERKPRT